MATIKQKKAIENIVENHGNVSRAMLDAGYDPTTAKNPKNLTESKGYTELLDELGLTDGFIISNLVTDIKDKPGNRIQELNLAAKLRGRMTEKIDLNGKLDVASGTADPIVAAQFAEFLKNK